MYMRCLLPLILLAGAPPPQSAEKPFALRAFEEARLSIAFADMHWTHTLPLSSHPEPMHIRTLVARDDVASITIGTENGVSGWRQNDEPVVDSPPAMMESRQGVWLYRLDSTDANLWEHDTPNVGFSHIRSLGMIPQISISSSPDRIIDQTLLKYCGSVTYREKVTEGGVHRVEATSSDKKTKFVWYIDPALGWNATRTEYWYKGERHFQSLTEYEKMNGVFVPV